MTESQQADLQCKEAFCGGRDPGQDLESGGKRRTGGRLLLNCVRTLRGMLSRYSEQTSKRVCKHARPERSLKPAAASDVLQLEGTGLGAAARMICSPCKESANSSREA